MTKKQIVYALFAFVIPSLLIACGPAISPTVVASLTPTEMPGDTPAPTPTPTPTPTATAVAYQEGFEETLDRWQQGADVPEDPERPADPVAWSIALSSEQASEGSSSARFTLDGKQGDGTIWLARPFEVAPYTALRVHLAFDLWSASESFNTLAKVSAYGGPRPPVAESDFDLNQPANQVTGWKTYDYAFNVRSGAEGQIWVALGISAVWETEMIYYVDNARLEIAPGDEGRPPDGRITVKGVEVTATQGIVRGKSTLPDGTCVSAELWADGAPLTWWPTDACAPVRQGAWELVVRLPEEQALRPGVQYMVRAYQPGGPDIVSTFPFDLDAPPTPPTEEPVSDLALLLPDAAELLSRASADLDGDSADELVFLAGFGGSPDRLGYDYLALLVLTPSTSEEAVAGYELAWHSDPLVGDRAESLEVKDVNGDGHPEILCLQARGAAGQVRADAHLAELAATVDAVLLLAEGAPDVTDELRALPDVQRVERIRTPEGQGYRVRGTNGADLRPAIFELAREQTWPLRELRRDVRTLETVFNELATADGGSSEGGDK